MNDNISWIATISYEDADTRLRSIFDHVRSADGHLDNLYQAFSLRAHTIKPADDLYRAALHNDANTLPPWFAELIGSYVAILTGCHYALAHHGHNFSYLLDDPARAEMILQSLRDDELEQCGNEREVSVLRYVKKLCLAPQQISADDVAALKEQGWDDGEILEIVQIVAMFSYFTRVINGIGISLHGDRIGLY